MNVSRSPYFAAAVLETRLRHRNSTSNNNKAEDVTNEPKKLKTAKKHKVRSGVPFTVPNSVPEPLTCGFERYTDKFYDIPAEDLAKNLLGQVLVRQLENGITLRGRIVETECYPGGDDEASHSYQGRCTERNYPSYMKPGTTYVYMTYGMYHCINISSKEPGGCVLLRALEPIGETTHMETLRNNQRNKPKKSEIAPEKNDEENTKKSKQLKLHELCNGPSKLCISFDMDRHNCNVKDLCSWKGLWVEPGTQPVKQSDIVACPRIGIDSVGGEWVLKPFRFYIMDNMFVSRRDKKKENELRNQR